MSRAVRNPLALSVRSTSRRASLSLLVREIFQQQAVPHDERVDVPPATPGVGGDVELHLLSLARVESLQKLDRRAADRFG